MAHRKKILVVEDNELNRAMLKEELSDDYEVFEAENGKEALDILYRKKEEITVVLLDVIMPVMDGYTFLDIMRKDSDLALIPVIVLTLENREEDEIAALQHGANDFMQKPYRPQLIRHRIENLIKFRENAALVKQFKYDKLTGLYTKEYFYQKVRKRLDENPDKEYTIVCTNIENFMLYNDTFGRKAGDHMLAATAKMLRERVTGEAICGRYGADRMLCLMEKENELRGRESFIKARKVRRSSLSANMSVKLGIYEIIDRTIPVELMCDRALWVVDSIKGSYDEYVAVYDDTFRNQSLRERAITDIMETALKEKQFVVYFQPKHDLQQNRMVGAEALVRWIHPQWGFMPPNDFIPLFEKNGFIHCLDEYVWEHTCEKLREWLDLGYEVVPVSVNVSRIDVYQMHLVDLFSGLMDKYQLDPSLLHLEITESAYTENPEQIIETIRELQKRGFVIEMDDFGSGYSSLNMLSQMSIDILKLDMGFVRNEMEKPIEQSIINDIVNMAHRINLEVVAEGVETIDQKDRLQIMGCDYAQGYYYAKPMPEDDFINEFERKAV